MNGFLNIADHYWKILDRSDDGVYQSKTNSMVPDSDSRYAQWRTVAGDATPIASERELALTLRNRASALPEWLLSAPSFIQPSPDSYSADQLKAYANDARWRKEQGGTTSTMGPPIKTDDRAQAKITGLHTAVTQPAASQEAQPSLPPTRYTDFHFADGTIQSISTSMIIGLNNDLLTHINDCFSISAMVHSEIDDGSITTLEQIDAAFDAPMTNAAKDWLKG